MFFLCAFEESDNRVLPSPAYFTHMMVMIARHHCPMLSRPGAQSACLVQPNGASRPQRRPLNGVEAVVLVRRLQAVPRCRTLAILCACQRKRHEAAHAMLMPPTTDAFACIPHHNRDVLEKGDAELRGLWTKFSDDSGERFVPHGREACGPKSSFSACRNYDLL